MSSIAERWVTNPVICDLNIGEVILNPVICELRSEEVILNPVICELRSEEMDPESCYL